MKQSQQAQQAQQGPQTSADLPRPASRPAASKLTVADQRFSTERELARDDAPRGEPASTLVPPVDIFEDEGGFTVIADLPGVSRDRLGVRVTGDSLVIEGTAEAPAIGNMELLYGEVLNPQYRRSFSLSRELDPGKIEARLNNGVLRLRIPKAEEARPRRINVQVG